MGRAAEAPARSVGSASHVIVERARQRDYSLFQAGPELGLAVPRKVARHHVLLKGPTMSFQAYLDTIEDKTGLTPRQFIGLAKDKGFGDDSVKAGVILEWLKTDYGLGRGHGMALVHVIKRGPQIDPKHVGSGGAHNDESDMLWLDGKASRPA